MFRNKNNARLIVVPANEKRHGRKVMPFFTGACRRQRMKFVLTVFKFALFVAAISFAVVNTDIVVVRYYFGVEWRAPMVLVLLAAFGVGLLGGWLMCLPHMVRRQFEVSRLKKTVREAEASAALSVPSVPSAAAVVPVPAPATENIKPRAGGDGL